MLPVDVTTPRESISVVGSVLFAFKSSIYSFSTKASTGRQLDSGVHLRAFCLMPWEIILGEPTWSCLGGRLEALYWSCLGEFHLVSYGSFLVPSWGCYLVPLWGCYLVPLWGCYLVPWGCYMVPWGSYLVPLNVPHLGTCSTELLHT